MFSRESEEENKEEDGIDEQLWTHARADSVVVHIVMNVECTQNTCQEYHCDTENNYPRVQQYV